MTSQLNSNQDFHPWNGVVNQIPPPQDIGRNSDRGGGGGVSSGWGSQSPFYGYEDESVHVSRIAENNRTNPQQTNKSKKKKKKKRKSRASAWQRIETALSQATSSSHRNSRSNQSNQSNQDPTSSTLDPLLKKRRLN